MKSIAKALAIGLAAAFLYDRIVKPRITPA